jgi:outer membrane lipoprotein-sorting protein
MTKYFRFILPALAVVLFLNAAATETPAQILREILKRMDINNKGLVSLKGNVKMNKFDSTLGDNDLTEGEINYRPGKSESQIFLRIDWAKPAVEHLVIANGEYVLYRPRANRAIVGKVDGVKNKNSKAGGALAFMTMSRAQLSENYDIDYKGEETVNSGTSTWHLVLTPKKPTSFKSADLWVDKNGMPVQVKIVEKNNDSTTILLSGVERNPTLNGNIFKITPPKGTEIVRS